MTAAQRRWTHTVNPGDGRVFRNEANWSGPWLVSMGCDGPRPKSDRRLCKLCKLCTGHNASSLDRLIFRNEPNFGASLRCGGCGPDLLVQANHCVFKEHGGTGR